LDDRNSRTYLARLCELEVHGICCTRLSCYEAQLANVPKGRAHPKGAVGIDPKFKLMALEDPDLEPVWALLIE
jgi:hypothetical protein